MKSKSLAGISQGLQSHEQGDNAPVTNGSSRSDVAATRQEEPVSIRRSSLESLQASFDAKLGATGANAAQMDAKLTLPAESRERIIEGLEKNLKAALAAFLRVTAGHNAGRFDTWHACKLANFDVENFCRRELRPRRA